MTQQNTIITHQTPEFLARAKQLSAQFNIPWNKSTQPPQHILTVTKDGLKYHPESDPGNILFLDFIHGNLGFRIKTKDYGRQRPIAKAIGLNKYPSPYVLDATGGMGRDALLLALSGAKISIVERSIILYALLSDALDRAKADPDIASKIACIQLYHADSTDFLKQLKASEQPDVVYIDPMYPSRSKSALVKKEMRLIRNIVGDDDDASMILDQALITAKHRVVVKRPMSATPIKDNVSHVIKSKKTRFDIYLIK